MNERDQQRERESWRSRQERLSRSRSFTSNLAGAQKYKLPKTSKDLWRQRISSLARDGRQPELPTSHLLRKYYIHRNILLTSTSIGHRSWPSMLSSTPRGIVGYRLAGTLSKVIFQLRRKLLFVSLRAASITVTSSPRSITLICRASLRTRR